MAVTELLEHSWLNEGVVPDVPLDSPSIIVSDEVCFQFIFLIILSTGCNIASYARKRWNISP